MTVSYVISGFVVGMLIGLTGVGGGSLMTPLLTLLFDIHPNIAVGTDLAFSAATKTAGTFVHRFKETVRWDIVRRLCYGAIPAAIITTLLLKHFGAIAENIAQMIRYIIAISVILTIIALLFKSKLQTWLHTHTAYHLNGTKLIYATIFSGFLLGTLVTISSIGAGVVGATLLILLYPHLSPAEIAGTDIAYAVPLTTVAAFGHWWLCSIDSTLLIALLLGSIPGITIGSLVARAIPEKFLRGLLTITLTSVAIKLIF